MRSGPSPRHATPPALWRWSAGPQQTVRGTAEGLWRVLAGQGKSMLRCASRRPISPASPHISAVLLVLGIPTRKGLPMTPQFLRSEAARFRDMAESTEREASRQRLLAMAVDYQAQAEEAEKLQPPEQMQSDEPEPRSDGAIEPELASDGAIEPEPGVTGSPSRLRLSRKAGPRRGI
jgi:hypothetical protein